VIRVLQPGDEERLDRFLGQHADSSLFLRSNALVGGLRDEGRPRHCTYVARFEGEELVAVVAHSWNGNLLVQAPSGAGELARRAAAATGRRIAGVLGPWQQACAVLNELGLSQAETSIRSCEDLFALDLDALRVPALLAAAAVACRPAEPADLDQLAEWRRRYAIETLGEPDRPDLLRSSREEVSWAQASGSLFVLGDGRELLATCAFNARHPACVQIGGVWTPPALRGRGYGRAVVAGALLAARQDNVPRSVLFTDQHNAPARRAYESLGYQRVGDYALIMFRSAALSGGPEGVAD
jgi:uncharacterized protein